MTMKSIFRLSLILTVMMSSVFAAHAQGEAGDYGAAEKEFVAANLPNPQMLVGVYLGKCVGADNVVTEKVPMWFGYLNTIDSGPTYFGSNLQTTYRWQGLTSESEWRLLQRIFEGTSAGSGTIPMKKSGSTVVGQSYVCHIDDGNELIDYETEYRVAKDGKVMSRISSASREVVKEICSWYQVAIPCKDIPTAYAGPQGCK